jgi:hypothetical protein
MQIFTSKPVEVSHQLGDVVTWKGIKMIVVELFDDGSIKAVSKTTIVHVSDHGQLEAT